MVIPPTANSKLWLNARETLSRGFIVIGCVAAADNIALAYAIANFGNPTGWSAAVAFGITMAYTVGTTVAISCFTNACANDNKERCSS